MRDREATRAIRELAERQHGLVARWELLEIGIGERVNQVRAEAGLLVPVFRGVFSVGHGRITRKGRWMAAVLASGPRAVLSHGSAMHLWGMRGSREPVEVLRRAGGPRYRRPGIRIHQTRRLPVDHVTEEAGIPVTTIERTLLDMAGRLGDRRLERAIVAADRSGRLSWAELARLVRSGRGKKGIPRLRRIAVEVDPRAADAFSPPEVDFLALCREAGLPLPEVNVLVEDNLVDFLWPAAKVVVETDSYAYHGDRVAFENDHEGTVALTVAGYEVHRATAKMLSRDPTPFLRLVRRSLRHRTASTSLPAGSRS
jgi:hypothetical protein